MQGCECTCKFSVSFLQLWKFKFKFRFNSFSFSWPNRRREICSKKKKNKRRNWLDHDKWSLKNEINHELWFFLFLQSLSFFFANASSLVEKFLMAKILDYIDLSPSEQKQTNRPLVRPLSTVKKNFQKKKINSPNSWKNIEIKSCDSIELQ